MTTEEVKRILKTPYKPLALAALSYVNLTDRECQTLILRYMRGLTIEQAAEYLDCSENSVKNWQGAGLDKCGKAWENIILIREVLKATQ